METMRRLAVLPITLALVIGAACHSDARPPAQVSVAGSSLAKAKLSNWSMYHGSPSHSGHVGHAAGSPLHQIWAADLQGAVYGEPLVVHRRLIVATESDQVFGLNAKTGRTKWQVSLGTPQPQSGLPCGDIDPLGITGTPAYDRKTHTVFAVAETVGGHHTLWAINPRNGHREWHENLDVLADRNPLAEQQRSALLVTAHRVIVSFGGLYGDCDNYVGYITSTPVSGKGRTHYYAVPTEREAGMWSAAGPMKGADGNVYVASGNGAEVSGQWDRSDSVTELTPKRLSVVSIFAPSTWPQDNAQDLDLGSSSPVGVRSLHRIVIAGKRGVVYLLPEHFNGIGSELADLDGCAAFGGPAVAGTTVLMPCLFSDQVRALQVGSSGLQWGWTADNLYGSPIVAGSRVYVADSDSGDLVVLDLANGAVVQRIHAGSLTHFPSSVVDGGYVFVPTMTGVTAFHG